jgi:hypothetical protein
MSYETRKGALDTVPSWIKSSIGDLMHLPLSKLELCNFQASSSQYNG